LKYNPRDEKAANNLNIILAEQMKDKKAEDNFKKMIAVPNPKPTSIYNHGIFLYKQGKLVEAL
jgi:Tfp pilus assembly protein PilF